MPLVFSALQRYDVDVKTLDISSRNRIFLALACADAMGAATEFKSQRAIAEKYPDGIRTFLPGSPFGFKPGEATDDTQMVVATVAALNAARDTQEAHEARMELPAAKRKGTAVVLISDVEALDAHYADWLAGNPPDVGGTCRSGINNGGFETWERGRYDAAGNGGLMRVAGVIVAGTPYESHLRLAVLSTALTHIDPRSVLACAFFSELLYLCADGIAYPTAVSFAQGAMLRAIPDILVWLTAEGLLPASSRQFYAERLNSDVGQVQEAISRGMSGFAGSQSGYVLDTLQAAVCHNLTGKTWMAVSSACAMLGNDSDTAGAVAGALAGARGLKPEAEMVEDLRIGASWGDWDREWNMEDHLSDLIR